MVWELLALVGPTLVILGIVAMLEIIRTCRRITGGLFGKDASL